MSRSSKSRNSRDLRRRIGKWPTYDRVLIVCEGEKTECNYFEEIRQDARISSAQIVVLPSSLGSDPQKVVESAEQVFERKGKAFERVYVVFDRDDHPGYETALKMVEARNGKLKNDEKRPLTFEAVVSVPCFELWFLLHYVDARSWIHRDTLLRQLRGHIGVYQKGSAGLFALTEPLLAYAMPRAKWLKVNHQRIPGDELYTDVHELVEYLVSLGSKFH